MGKADERLDRQGNWDISANWKANARSARQSRRTLQAGGLNVNNNIGISPFRALNGAISRPGTLTTIISPALTNEFSNENWLPNAADDDSKYLRKNSGITLPLLYPNADPLGVVPNMTWDAGSNSPTINIGGPDGKTVVRLGGGCSTSASRAT